MRESHARERFANLDGSPFGTKGLRRFVSTPSVKWGGAAAAFAAAAEAMLSPGTGKEKLAKLLPYAVINAISHIGVQIAQGRATNKMIAKDGLENAVIDKLGRREDNSSATLLMGHLYHRTSRTLLETTFFWPAFDGLWYLSTSADMRAPAAIMAMGAMTMLSGFVKGAWYGHASNKLRKREWTIQTSPPEIVKDEAKSEAAGFAPAPSLPLQRIPALNYRQCGM
ncbi:MAG: hypothetical protein WDO70_05710 [Alphaproteobacteria bacterium]